MLFRSLSSILLRRPGRFPFTVAGSLLRLALLVSISGLLLPTAVSAGVTKTLHVEWAYNTTIPGLVGYRLYQEGLLAAQVDNPAALSMDWSLNLRTGANTFTMTAFDANGRESAPSVPYVVEVPAPDASGNIPPVAVANVSSVQGLAPLTVTFDSTGSVDYDGNITAYSWNFGAASHDSGPKVQHTFSIPGTYRVYLDVTDNRGAVSTASVVVTVTSTASSVKNASPVAAVDIDVASGPSPLTVRFNGSRSSDPDGFIKGYSWAFSDGHTATGGTTSKTFNKPGTYAVWLTVTDDRGATASARTVITVTAPLPVPPAAVISATATRHPYHAEWTYDGSVANLAGFRLYANGVQICETADVNARSIDCTANLEAGLVELTVTAFSSQGSETIIADQAFIDATFLVPPLVEGEAPLAVTFNGLASTDNDGDIVNWTWEFGDGDTVNAPAAIHEYSTPGVYPVTLIVTDSQGLSATAATFVTVLEPSNHPPTATGGTLATDAGKSVSGILGANDPDQDQLTFTIVDDPASGTVTLTDSGAGAFTYTPSAGFSGQDSFLYKVSDGKAESGIATFTLNVAPANSPPVATPDLVFITQNTIKTINVLKNDSDAEGTLILFAVGSPAHGKATISGSSIVYQPFLNFVGTDIFSYTIRDKGGLTATTTVAVVVVKS